MENASQAPQMEELQELEQVMRGTFLEDEEQDETAESSSSREEASTSSRYGVNPQVRQDDTSTCDSTPYTYLPLPTESHFRLLILFPGEPDSPLRGTLTHASLSSPSLPFETISYAWGDASKPHSLDLGSGALPLTRSAHSALRRFRLRDSPRTLWLDTVCIDQSLASEKSSQVAVMDEIYGLSSRVLCWLGEDEDGGGEGGTAFELILALADARFNALPDDLLTTEFMLANGLPRERDGGWIVARKFFERPWFRRRWVVQEFVLPAAATLVCGEAEVDWKALIIGMNLVVQYQPIMWGGSEEREGSSMVTPLREMGKSQLGVMAFQSMIILKLRRTYAEVDIGEALKAMFNRDSTTVVRRFGAVVANPDRWWNMEFQKTFEPEVVEMMSQGDSAGVMFQSAIYKLLGFSAVVAECCRSTLCELVRSSLCSITTDPRDQYFAFLGLSTERNLKSLQPDYTLSAESVHLRFAKYFLFEQEVKRGQLNMPLIEAGIARQRSDLKLPSWVPQYSAELPHLLVSGGRIGTLYKAAGDTRRIGRCTSEQHKICVSASCIDSIVEVLPQPAYPQGCGDEFRSFFEKLDRMTVHAKDTYPYPIRDEDGFEMQWRMLIGDSQRQGLAPDSSYGEQYADDRRKIEYPHSAEIIWEDPEFAYMHLSPDWGSRWGVMALHYSVCRTQTGLVGLVPNGTQVGDSVWIILGENMPLVLRQQDDACQLYGACYIHGIMNGEALESDSWNEEEISLI